jgi:hypothetical protein
MTGLGSKFRFNFILTTYRTVFMESLVRTCLMQEYGESNKANVLSFPDRHGTFHVCSLRDTIEGRASLHLV